MIARRARAVMVLGTASNAGKSLIATALCRILARQGHAVAPFKAQNMSLNSAATPDGLEIGRAQALQAEAARLAPRADMNPVLLKPMSSTGSQAVVNGRVWGNVLARDFVGGTKALLWPSVCAAYDRLASEFELIVIEGAGSPAEINLREHDIVNMSVAHYAEARALLVADIDRGGAFAAVAGTMALLDERDRTRIVGYAFNKFRGDASLLAPGIAMLEPHVGTPCLGIIPWLDTRGLDEEDGVCLERRLERQRPWSQGALRVAVVAVPHLSNFTDFDALEEEPSVALRYVRTPGEMRDADVVVLPGTKDTMSDLLWLRERGIDVELHAARARNAVVIGICGGMQMLGDCIEDALGIERGGLMEGLGALPLRSQFLAEKVTYPVAGETRAFGPRIDVHGYEIHVGQTTYASGARPFATIRRAGMTGDLRDGVVSADGNTIGTYLHGIFAGDEFRHAFLRWVCARREKALPEPLVAVAARREERLDALADAVEGALDVRALLAETPATRA
ncbi:MAG TPA: cobyric acid synthase [Candidatus Baltobacteraceae bacterium]|nr:cobyric acid synthase [Candidatus Baltobacteraceae bacterium]